MTCVIRRKLWSSIPLVALTMICPGTRKGVMAVIDGAHMLGRHGTDHNLRARHGYRQIRYVIYLRRNGKPWEVGPTAAE